MDHPTKVRDGGPGKGDPDEVALSCPEIRTMRSRSSSSGTEGQPAKVAVDEGLASADDEVVETTAEEAAAPVGRAGH